MRSLTDTYRLYFRTLDFIKPGKSFVAVFLGLCIALLLFAGLGFALSEFLVPKMTGRSPGGNGEDAWNRYPGEYTLIVIVEGWKAMLTAGLFPGLFWIMAWIFCKIRSGTMSCYRSTTAWMFNGEPPDPRRSLSPRIYCHHDARISTHRRRNKGTFSRNQHAREGQTGNYHRSRQPPELHPLPSASKPRMARILLAE